MPGQPSRGGSATVDHASRTIESYLPHSLFRLSWIYEAKSERPHAPQAKLPRVITHPSCSLPGLIVWSFSASSPEQRNSNLHRCTKRKQTGDGSAAQLLLFLLLMMYPVSMAPAGVHTRKRMTQCGRAYFSCVDVSSYRDRDINLQK